MLRYIPVNTLLNKNCERCKRIFHKKINVSQKKWEITKYCSKSCARIGKDVWNKGLIIDRKKYPNMGHFQKHTKESLIKITNANRINAKKKPKEFFQAIQKKAIKVGKLRNSYKGQTGIIGELNTKWKGNDATYNTKHKWISKYWIKTGICQNCGIKPIIKGRNKNATQWHNIDKKYDRNIRKSWIELCTKCHRKEEINDTRCR